MALDTVIKISGTIPANTTTNAIASIDVPEDGEIMSIGGAIIGSYVPVPAPAANITLQLVGELSFNSTNQIGANDSRGGIAGVAVATSFVWSEAAETGGGGGNLSEHGSITFDGGLTVNAGERIFIHGISSHADLTATLTFLMYMKTRGGGRRSPKRR